MHLPGIYQTSNRLIFSIGIITSKKDIQNILLLQTTLLTNEKYEVVKRKLVVGYDSRRAWVCNFINKETLVQVFSCEFVNFVKFS